MPARSRRYGVGKTIGGAVYLHRQYEHLLGSPVQEAKEHLPPDFDYTIVKYHEARGSVSFLHSPDFDTAPEPTVGDSWIIYADGRKQQRRQAADAFIYHHKWLFVADDYIGFDVNASRGRSREWMSLTPPVDYARIGRQSYWEEVELPRLRIIKNIENG